MGNGSTKIHINFVEILKCKILLAVSSSIFNYLSVEIRIRKTRDKASQNGKNDHLGY